MYRSPDRRDPEGRVAAGVSLLLRGRWSGAGGEEVGRRAERDRQGGLRDPGCGTRDHHRDPRIASRLERQGDPGGETLADAVAMAVVLGVVVRRGRSLL